MDGYERRKQRKMERILDTSFEMFAKHGFQKIAVGEIAEKAKVSPTTIYNYFGTKEQLYAAALTHWMDKQLRRYEEILNSGLTFPEKTREIMLLEAENLRILADGFLERSGLTELMEGGSGQKVEHFFRKYVALGKQEGYIHSDQTEEMSMRYFGMFKNELSRYWMSSQQERVTGEIDLLLELFFYGLSGRRYMEQ